MLKTKKNLSYFSSFSHIPNQIPYATCVYTMFSMIKEQTYEYVAKQVKTEFKINK